MNCLKRFWWVFLYAAFVGAAVLLHDWVRQNDVAEVWGWDYATFVGQINDWRWVGYFGFRHPGLGLVCAPLVVVQHLWSCAYLLVMPAIATATAWLIWRRAGWLALGVWLIFPTTWLMAGIPESFPIAQLALVGSVCLLASEPRRDRLIRVGLLACMNGLITLTNGVKPIAAYVATCGDWKKAARVVGGMLALALVGVGFFAVRSWVTGRGIGAGLEATLSWIPESRNLPQELYGFFIRPAGLVQSCFVYPLLVWSAVRLIRRHETTMLLSLGSCFAVDAAIHLVVGWGMSEPWVFAPHWLWMLPLVIGIGMKGLRK